MKITRPSGPTAYRAPTDDASLPGLIAVGISHRTAPLELIGRCELPGADGSGGLLALRERAGAGGILALSTCNRREFYAWAADPLAVRAELSRELAAVSGLDGDDLARILYVHRGRQAARHLFRVVTSLDSMVVGESEIQGQVRRAWEHALREHATDPALDRLFRAALQVGKRVRRTTRIGEGRMSVPSVAVKLVEEAVGPLTDRRVLVVGTGAMSRIVAGALAARGLRDVTVAGRRASAAHALAHGRSWRGVSLAELGGEIARSDVVFSATAAPGPLVRRCTVQAAMAARAGRPMALIDLAVPRDIDPAVADVHGVSLHSMEDLRRIGAASSSARREQARHAEALVAHEVERFVGGSPGSRSGLAPESRAVGPSMLRASPRRRTYSRAPETLISSETHERNPT